MRRGRYTKENRPLREASSYKDRATAVVKITDNRTGNALTITTLDGSDSPMDFTDEMLDWYFSLSYEKMAELSKPEEDRKPRLRIRRRKKT